MKWKLGTTVADTSPVGTLSIIASRKVVERGVVLR